MAVQDRKPTGSEERKVHSHSLSNIYEIAVASAKEAKRINRRFLREKKLPPDNVTITAIRKVIEGNVPYVVEGDFPESPTGGTS